jgi:hypothetical protein
VDALHRIVAGGERREVDGLEHLHLHLHRHLLLFLPPLSRAGAWKLGQATRTGTPQARRHVRSSRTSRDAPLIPARPHTRGKHHTRRSTTRGTTCPGLRRRRHAFATSSSRHQHWPLTHRGGMIRVLNAACSSTQVPREMRSNSRRLRTPLALPPQVIASKSCASPTAAPQLFNTPRGALIITRGRRRRSPFTLRTGAHARSVGKCERAAKLCALPPLIFGTALIPAG